jgi:hypothetical protein
MLQDIGWDIADVMDLAVSTGLFVSLCTAQAPDGLLIDAGQPSGNYVNVTGLVDIPCMNAPMSEAKLQAAEIKALADIEAFSPRHVLLSGYYPAFDDGVHLGWRVVIDGTPYDLMGSEGDSQSQMTRLACRTSGV